MAVLAIDQGTSGTKAIVVDDDGVILGDALVSVRPIYGDDGSVEVDPLALWQSVLDAGRAWHSTNCATALDEPMVRM